MKRNETIEDEFSRLNISRLCISDVPSLSSVPEITRMTYHSGFGAKRVFDMGGLKMMTYLTSTAVPGIFSPDSVVTSRGCAWITGDPERSADFGS